MAGKGRERKEPKNTRNRPEAKNCRILSTSFARFLQLWPKRGGHFRFAYYELKEAVGTSFRLVHERHHHGLLAVADEKRPTRRMVSPSDPLAMVALGHKAMLGNKWCLGCTFITWSMRSRNDDLDCEACLWPRWMRSSCRFRKGSRVRDEKQEKKKEERKKKEEKKGKRGGQRFGECFFPMKRCAITTEENKGRTRMGWMRLFRLLRSLLVSEIRLCGQMFFQWLFRIRDFSRWLNGSGRRSGEFVVVWRNWDKKWVKWKIRIESW